MTPEYRAEILAHAERYRHRPYVGLATMARHITELNARVVELEADRDKVWGVVGRLRDRAKADGRDPYSDPVAQELSAILCHIDNLEGA